MSHNVHSSWFVLSHPLMYNQRSTSCQASAVTNLLLFSRSSCCCTAGFIHGTNWSLDSVPGNIVMFMTCLGVLSMVTHLRTFSSEQVLVARESESGVSMSAFFVSQNMIDLIWVFTAPAIMLGPYYYLTLPVSDCQTSSASHAPCSFHNTLHCVNTNSSYLQRGGPQQRIPITQPAPATARLACHPAPVPPVRSSCPSLATTWSACVCAGGPAEPLTWCRRCCRRRRC